MTSHGPIKDVSKDGYLDCSEKLSSVLYELCKRKTPPDNKRLIKVLVSDLARRNREVPERIEKIKFYSFRYLLKEYTDTFGETFTLEGYAEKKSWKLEALAQQGRKEMAFAQYGQIMYIKKLIEHEKSIQDLPEDERLKKEEEFNRKNHVGMIRIG